MFIDGNVDKLARDIAKGRGEILATLSEVWGAQDAEFDYYFLDENYSYQLLSLLQIARENLALTKKFSVQAIPSDTVRAPAESDLLEALNYRVAFSTRLLHQANEVDAHLFDAAEKANQGNYPSKSEFSGTERAEILELTYELLNFQLYDQGLEWDLTVKLANQAPLSKK